MFRNLYASQIVATQPTDGIQLAGSQGFKTAA